MSTLSRHQGDSSLEPLLTRGDKEVKVHNSIATKPLESTVIVTETSSESITPNSLSDGDIGEEPEVSFNPATLQAKYDAERDKRVAANPKGLNQYLSVNHDDPVFGKYLRDPYIKDRISRDPIKEETEVLIIGGGYGGLLVAVRLIEKGITNIRILEVAGDFGGTW